MMYTCTNIHVYVCMIGEGIQQGNQCFGSLALSTIVATTGMLTSLHFFGKSLLGVWGSLGVFNVLRLVGVLRHHYVDGPLSVRSIRAAEARERVGA